MNTKAFLGTGLLGSGFVRAMTGRGDNVQVWNRTTEKAKALEPYGATAFADVADAVQGASRIHVALKEDATVDEVLEKARGAFAPGVVIIDHTTTTKEGAVRRTAYWKEQGFVYQHAPVFMGPSNAMEASGFMLVSGDPNTIDTLRAELSVMTGKLLELGPEVGKAAALKLTGNAFLVCFLFGLREALSVGGTLGINSEDLGQLLGQWNPAAQTATRLERLSATGDVQPSWELAMARKDTQLFLDAARHNGTDLTLLPAIAAVMDKWIDKGFGHHDWTVVGKDVQQ